jgi:hypothetical protein
MKKLKSLLIIVSLIFFISPVFATSQTTNNVKTTARNCHVQELGTGLSGSLDTLMIKIYNDSGGAIGANTSPNTGNNLSIWEYSGSGYLDHQLTNRISPFSTTISPSSRYSSGNITSDTSPTNVVSWTNNYTGKTFDPSKYYAIVFKASNGGNRLKTGASSTNTYTNGAYGYDDDSDYCNWGYDLLPQLSTESGVNDMYFTINGEIGLPDIITSGTGAVDPFTSSQIVSFSGDLKQVATGYYADVQIWSECTKTGHASVNSDTPVIHIRVDSATCATTTRKISESEYTGYKYCASPAEIGRAHV